MGVLLQQGADFLELAVLVSGRASSPGSVELMPVGTSKAAGGAGGRRRPSMGGNERIFFTMESERISDCGCKL